jgi:hypothetical protein
MPFDKLVQVGVACVAAAQHKLHPAIKSIVFALLGTLGVHDG